MRINLSHGSGGKATSNLIQDVFAKRLGNTILNRQEDAAVLDAEDLPAPGGKLAFSTDSFVVTPLFFEGGDIGRLAVCGTVNDLLCMGARPLCLSAGFILEEGLLFEDLEKIVISMAAMLEESGTRLAAADTKVVEGRGGLYINTSGIGAVAPGTQVGADRMKPGDKIILSGTLGDHHAAILSRRMKIENNIQSDAAPLNSLVLPLLEAGLRVHAMRDVTRGGLATVLNELAASSGVSLRLYSQSLPVSESVKALCDILGLDPLYMGNEGKLAIVVDKADADEALRLIRKSPYGLQGALVGEVTQGSGVYLSTETGSLRSLPVLYGEGLPRIC